MIKTSIFQGALASGIVLVSLGSAQAQTGWAKSGGWTKAEAVALKLGTAPAAPKMGNTITFTLKLTAAKAAKGIADLEVFDKGTKRVFQGIKGDQTFVAGKTKVYVFKWKPTAPGVYSVKAGIFNPGWASLLFWNDKVTTLTIK